MKKGIAVETILLLLLGILVVGILVYLLYKYVFNPVLPEQVCRSRATSWCTFCKNAYGSTFKCPTVEGVIKCFVPVGQDLSDCAKEYFSAVPHNCPSDEECCHLANSWCAAFIGWG